MSSAPERIWAYYAPHIAEDENGATIIAYETAQHGAQAFVRSDLHTALLADRDRLAARVEELEREVACPIGLDRGLQKLCSAGTCPTCLAALADRLAAEVWVLREALTRISDPEKLQSHGDPGVLRDAARAALQGD